MAENLSDVIASGMCIGCGACVAADPSVELVLDDKTQSFRPSHPSTDRAASVCPAIAVDFAWLQSVRFPGAEVGEHGVVETVLLAQSTNHERNVKASSGGLIKEMLLDLLSRDDVDGIISIVHKGGIDFEAELISDAATVDTLPGSIYHALPFDGALKVLQENDGRYVLVAIPCQLEGIFTYIHRFRPELADRIHTTIGLLCGWQYTHHALRAVCEYKGMDFDAITDISFRGGGPVGKLQITTPDKSIAVSRRVDFSYQVAFDRSFNIPRCHLCVNHSNFLADIVVGDAWLPSTVFTSTGISLLICRTPDARAMIDGLAEAGRIKSTEVSVNEILESQTHRVVFGDFAYPYQEFLASKGLHHPVMTGPNRVETKPVPPEDVIRFHEELELKLELQAQRRYKKLWWRKLGKEFPRLAKRYVDWFLVRIVRIKSLKGEREEISRDQMRIFD
jgi:coenzyme F420 hydrogenase subunit beta